jgi:hypothetical protein
MRRWTILPTACALLAGLTGCPDDAVLSEQGQWILGTGTLVTGAHRGYAYGEPVLAGTPLRSALEFEGQVPEGYEAGEVLDECVEQSIEGPASWDEACLLLEEAGEVTWYLDPTDCPLQESGLDLQADRIVFEVADPDGVEGEIHQWIEEYAEVDLEIEPGLPDEWTNPPGEPFLVMADQRVTLFPRLVDPVTGAPVAWYGPGGEVWASAREGAFERAEVGNSMGWVGLVLGEDATVDLGVSVGDVQWTAGTAQAVDGDAPESLEIVAGYLADGASEHRQPFGARAIVRDGQGRLIYGTPVTWEVTEGELAVYPGATEDSWDLPGADYAQLADACVRPSENVGRRTVVLQASYGDLSDSIELTWIMNDEPGSDDGWDLPEECQSGGCSCTTGGAIAPTALAALLPLLLWVRRR